MNWQILAALGAASTALVILITAILALLQLKEASRARKVAAFTDISRFLQREEIRKARRTLFEIPEKSFKDWTIEEIEEAEKACHPYDLAGIMVSEKLIEENLIVHKWRYSIIRCWEAAEPMVNAYRKDRGNDFWGDFEWLYKKAKEIKITHGAK